MTTTDRAADEFARLLGGMQARVTAERARLLGQPAEGCDGQRGIVKSVCQRSDGAIVVGVKVWPQGLPATYYAEDVRSAAEIGA